MPPRTLLEIQRYLKEQEYAFYNHPELLEEIQEHIYILNEKETEANTLINSVYTRCKILYKMIPEKRRKISETEYSPSKLTFSTTTLLESMPPPKPRETIKSILKETTNHKEDLIERKESIYISHLIEETEESDREEKIEKRTIFKFTEKSVEEDKKENERKQE
ncbi:hypothetical protein NEOKW01_1255 [Nematocida sp. AWRm80]|nr:hypothetical protein NEOKW01_1255 [Nematocida sp. AWRm80]